MQKILIIVPAPPCGSARLLSALCVATALVSQEHERVDLSLFMMSDAVVVGLPDQPVAEAADGLQQMIATLVEHGALVRLCHACAHARDPERREPIPGVAVATLTELAAVALEADKVITF